MLREMSEDLMDTLPAKGSIGKAVGSRTSRLNCELFKN